MNKGTAVREARSECMWGCPDDAIWHGVTVVPYANLVNVGCKVQRYDEQI